MTDAKGGSSEKKSRTVTYFNPDEIEVASFERALYKRFSEHLARGFRPDLTRVGISDCINCPGSCKCENDPLGLVYMGEYGGSWAGSLYVD